MSYDAERLYNLLPAVYRIRDAERGGPLRALLGVIAGEAAVLDDNLAQLYDDMFIETCAPWALPYVGDLIGVEGLPSAGAGGLTPRAEVANTIGYRRRKGTAAVLEQLARDVTGWPARAVEFFQLLATTQHVGHVRRENLSLAGVRDAARLERLGTAFERLAGEADLTHTADVRRVSGRLARGRYNIPNVGLFVWRLRAYSLTRTPAAPAFAGDRRRFRFHPLGMDGALFTLPESESEMAQAAGPLNVPAPISRRALERRLEDYYGGSRSFLVERAGATPADAPTAFEAEDIRVCDLGDAPGGGWAHTPLPAGVAVAVDPERGRVAFADEQASPPLVSFHYGFAADVGGGEYNRVNSIDAGPPPLSRVANTFVEGSEGALASVQSALGALGEEGGAVEIIDGGRYEETESGGEKQPLRLGPARRLELRAGDKRRATLALTKTMEIVGGDEGEVSINGLLISGAPLRVSGNLRRLRLRHCTLIAGAPGERGPAHAPALVVESADVEVEIDDCLVVGGLRVAADAGVRVRRSVIDSTSAAGVAYAAPGPGVAPGGALRVENSTVVGKVYATVIGLASNSIFHARLAASDAAGWRAPVQAEQRQKGCARFSYLPPGSRVPRRYSCQPAPGADESRVRPVFTSLRYGDPDYCRLSRRCPREIAEGADDESEMGVYHDLYQPQRESHLRARLDEYLRFGLEAGVFHAS
ncbi:MAG TPA: hypothetical protein VF668_21345 [Pyrinomonadaceae bacterium]|jgi:hypothetical protein